MFDYRIALPVVDDYTPFCPVLGEKCDTVYIDLRCLLFSV